MTARATRPFSERYFLADRCFTPVVACRNSAFWRWMSHWIPVMKLHTVGWWHWNSDCTPRRCWCCELCRQTLQSSNSRFRQGMWLNHKSLHVLIICGYECKCVRRTHPADRWLLAVTQQQGLFILSDEVWWSVATPHGIWFRFHRDKQETTIAWRCVARWSGINCRCLTVVRLSVVGWSVVTPQK